MCAVRGPTDCPPLPPGVQASLTSGASSVVGVGYSARPQGGGTAPIVVQACLRKPGSGQVLLTGHPQPPGPKVRAAVHEARVWLGLVERSVAALLGRGDTAELRGGGAMPGADQDLHVHLGGGWDGEDTSLLGGAIAVALVSLRLRCWPRADVAVLGAFSAAGKYLYLYSPWGHSRPDPPPHAGPPAGCTDRSPAAMREAPAGAHGGPERARLQGAADHGRAAHAQRAGPSRRSIHPPRT